MARPSHCRQISAYPNCHLFKPAGIPACDLEEIVLGVDELEAIRLADLQGLYHEQAAAHMNVSRPTFGRIVDEARHKIAHALIEGKVLRIEGGKVEMNEKRTFTCEACQHNWDLPYGTGRPAECPACQSAGIRRVRSRLGGRNGAVCTRGQCRQRQIAKGQGQIAK